MAAVGRKVKRVLLALLLFGAAVSAVQGLRNGMECVDFHWESAALFLQGENPYRYFLEGRLYKGVCVDATQAPSTIAFILPFGLLDQVPAHRTWAFCNLLFTAAFIVLMKRLWFPGDWFRAGIVGGVLVTGVAWRVTVGCGQSGIFSLLFLTLAFGLAERNRKWDWFWAGLLLAVGLFKYTITVPLALVFVVRRRWRTLAVCAGVHLLLTLGLGAWTGTNPLTLVRQSMIVGQRLNDAGGFADLAGLCTQLGLTDVRVAAVVGYVVFGGLLLGVTAAACRKRTVDSLVMLSVLALLADVVCYHRFYDAVSLVFPLAALVAGKLNRRAAVTCALLIGWVYFALRVLRGSPLQDTVGVPVSLALHLILLGMLLKALFGEREPDGMLDARQDV